MPGTPGSAAERLALETARGLTRPSRMNGSSAGTVPGPAQIVKVAGDNQSGQAGSILAIPLRVQVLDALAAPLANVAVTFTTSNPGGAFPGGTTIQTDATGFASTTWRLGSQAGPQTAQAAVGGPPPATFTATATAGPFSPTQSTVAVNPATITAGGGASTITVTARDAGGNPLAGLTVALTVNGAATLFQPSAPTDAAGQAVGTLTATVAGAKIVSATVGGTAVTQAATITVLPSTPTQIVALSATSFSVRFGTLVATAPTVQVRDAFGNGVPNVQVNFGITSGKSSVSPAGVATDGNG